MRYKDKDYFVHPEADNMFEKNRRDFSRKEIHIIDFIKNNALDCEYTGLLRELKIKYRNDRSLIKNTQKYIEECINNKILIDIDRIGVHSMDLSITNTCNAACVYCPSPRIRNKEQFMSPEDIEKIINDLLAPEFIKNFGRLKTIEIGGLSEPLLNPELIIILQKIRDKYPAELVLYTNGLLLDEELSLKLLQDELIDTVVISIDGIGQKDHFASKKIDYGTVENNLLDFIALRDNYKSKCRIVIQVMSYKKYCSVIRDILGRNPINAPVTDKTIEDNTELIIKKWQKHLSYDDKIWDAADTFQLRGEYKKERDNYPVEEEYLRCPWLNYVIHAINITSNGDWIICCNDFFKEGVLGNIHNNSLYDIAATDRKDFVRALINNNSANLPLRCKLKKYCQYLRSN